MSMHSCICTEVCLTYIGERGKERKGKEALHKMLVPQPEAI